MQCRRGLCYCVDHNGNQQEMEKNEAMKHELGCNDTCSEASMSTEVTEFCTQV